jgi:hypothetical protein
LSQFEIALKVPDERLTEVVSAYRGEAFGFGCGALENSSQLIEPLLRLGRIVHRLIKKKKMLE